MTICIKENSVNNTDLSGTEKYLLIKAADVVTKTMSNIITIDIKSIIEFKKTLLQNGEDSISASAIIMNLIVK